MISFTLPWPAKALHSNARAHWAAKHRATAAARQYAKVVAKGAKVGCWPNATIQISYYPPSRRGDPSNLPIACKAYIDGIADAMGDGCDDRHFKVDFPREFAGTKKGGELIFRVTE